MMTAWIAAAALAGIQGQAVLVDLPAAASEVAAELIWQDQHAPLVRRDEHWLALIGVDLDVPPGAHEVTIRYTFSDGATRDAREVLSVAKGQYPETHLEVEQRYVDLSPEDAQRAARESRHIAEIYDMRSDGTDWLVPFRSPLPGVSGGRNFGHRRFFNGQPRDPHSGADLRAAEGTTVLAANGGRVVLAENLFFSGNAVFIDHGAGIISVYLHLSQINVSVGDRIEQGEPVGLAGATGRVTGPHLHWGIRVLDARVDPFTLPGMPGR